jgi:hypothetical protein
LRQRHAPKTDNRSSYRDGPDLRYRLVSYLSLRHAAALKKFPVGMTMQHATGILHQPYYIYTNNSLDPEFCRILASSDGLVLHFDHDQKLTKVQLLIEAK